MRDLPRATFRGFQPHADFHDAREERIGACLLRPCPLVHAAEHDGVNVLQAGFLRSPDEDARMAHRPRLHSNAGNQRVENACPVSARQRKPSRRLHDAGQKVGERLSRLPLPERGDVARLVGDKGFQRASRPFRPFRGTARDGKPLSRQAANQCLDQRFCGCCYALCSIERE